ncbi:MAG: hypothetical protein JFR38_06990 [Muribaculaceae bacterium]|nr:hypothetical protein [Muribaculaceae bacterium]
MNSFDSLSKFVIANCTRLSSITGDESAYAWNDQGYMTADASRGITNIKYNHQGLPVQMRFSNGDMTVCTYDASGLLTKSVTIGRRSALRDYVADRVFSTGALLILRSKSNCPQRAKWR